MTKPRSLVETGAKAGDYVLGFKPHNRGLCLRLREDQEAGADSHVTGVIEIVTYPSRKSFQHWTPRAFEPEFFMERVLEADASASEIIKRSALRSLNDLRRQLCELANNDQPFRLHLSGNHTADVRHPGLVIIDSQTLIVSKPDAELPPPAVQKHSWISLIHVQNVELLPDEPTVVKMEEE